MEELVKTFHIDAGMLIAQMVNFTIVLLILYKFAYKPVLKMLNDRTKKIEKGLEDSENASKKLEEIFQKEKEIATKAKKEAQEIVKKAEEVAKKNQEAAQKQTKEESEKIIANAKKQIEQEKEKMVADIKGEIADLVVAASEKILGEKINKEKDKELIIKAIK